MSCSALVGPVVERGGRRVADDGPRRTALCRPDAPGAVFGRAGVLPGRPVVDCFRREDEGVAFCRDMDVPCFAALDVFRPRV